MLLNLAEICSNTTNLGPGNRFVVWVQGCPFNCQNCISPNWIPLQEANILDAMDLAQQIIATNNIEGITISGGEPMIQARGLTEVLTIVKQKRPELNVICFTGFELEKIESIYSKEMLDYIDVLITGLYVEALNNDKGLRGSTNQKIIFLSERLEKYKDYFYNKERNLEIHHRQEETLYVGIPKKKFAKL